jgi:hypothetical protein
MNESKRRRKKKKTAPFGFGEAGEGEKKFMIFALDRKAFL